MQHKSSAIARLWWLFRHECRITYYEYVAQFATDVSHRRLPWRERIPLLMFPLLPWVVVYAVNTHDLLAKGLPVLFSVSAEQMDKAVMMLISVILIVISGLLAASQFSSQARSVFARADLDLLLSSPLSPSAVFGCRLLLSSLKMLSFWLFFLHPFFLMAIWYGGWHWLGLPITLILMVLTATSVALGLLVVCARLAGVRRTVALAPVMPLVVLSGFAGLVLLVATGEWLSQQFELWIPSLRDWYGQLSPKHPVMLPARALLGEPQALLWFTVLALLSSVLVVRLCARWFVRGMLDAQSAANTVSPRAQQAIRTALPGAVARRELRMLLREHETLFVRLFTLAGMSAFPLIASKDINAVNTLPSAVLACAFMTVDLMKNAEPMADLIATSPVTAWQIRRIRIALSFMLGWVAALPALLMLGWLAPLRALAVLPLLLLMQVQMCSLVLWLELPQAGGVLSKKVVNLKLEIAQFLAFTGWMAVPALWIYQPQWLGADVAGLVLISILALYWRRQSLSGQSVCEISTDKNLTVQNET